MLWRPNVEQNKSNGLSMPSACCIPTGSSRNVSLHRLQILSNLESDPYWLAPKLIAEAWDVQLYQVGRIREGQLERLERTISRPRQDFYQGRREMRTPGRSLTGLCFRKEDHGEQAESLASTKVNFSRLLYLQQFTRLLQLLNETTEFYNTAGVTYEEAHERVLFFKDVIENKGGRPPDFLC